ncbi:SMI1/KNR4 family protein [Streptomyces tricolor]
MTDDFEHRHGFPPGTNQVRPADYDDQAAARTLAQVTPAPADLVTFYESIGEVSWPDVGTDRKARGLVIGSNGGGLIYVAGPEGAVFRTRTASLDEAELDKVADDLGQFLELLERSLTRFNADGELGYL